VVYEEDTLREEELTPQKIITPRRTSCPMRETPIPYEPDPREKRGGGKKRNRKTATSPGRAAMEYGGIARGAVAVKSHGCGPLVQSDRSARGT